ncbi:hypothetical protein [Nevskia sp.]|uniref:hypothetical protein n=1 Tax=Nevskia sp. TaxID=1929292 RepID=UPI0025D77E92|nr:hypothetical protein [Nevskia sp.]
MNRIRVVAASILPAAIGLLLTGCAVFTPPIEKPIIEDKSHASGKGAKVAVFSTTAARRSVLVQFPKGAVAGKVCAEAPPDTADALISSLTFAAGLKAKSAQAEGEAKAELNRQLATTVNALLDRSQGLQLFRDGAFHLCLAWQNGIIDGATYVSQYVVLLDKTSALIGEEIKLKGSRTTEKAAKADATSAKTDKSAVTKPVTGTAATGP